DPGQGCERRALRTDADESVIASLGARRFLSPSSWDTPEAWMGSITLALRVWIAGSPLPGTPGCQSNVTSRFIYDLALAHFPGYHAAQILVDRAGPVVLTGPNGAGKTNLIEAISLLAPGRGLRRATMEELAFAEGDGAWAVSAETEGMLGLATLGTGIDPLAREESVHV